MAKRSLTGRLYNAYKAFREPLHHEILPLSSAAPCLPTKSYQITAQTFESFWPNRLVISAAGTPGGAADWVVHDIKIAGKTQFARAGDLPGDTFAANAPQFSTDFDVLHARMKAHLVVTYIGPNLDGCMLRASLEGDEYNPGILETLFESISSGLLASKRLFKTPGVAA